ncbi:protein SDE2 homolog isoform X1 [Mizuhopecten yessoensis]|uniref:protein SDE2 homolog isoform X1 n=1 Tax=Mizuhopecten yessoensis TaxID=6573 RepID=UPI000B45B92B|nr:protein SDE2 homolog isoform X1 [Mizuhopecten yessoensis]
MNDNICIVDHSLGNCCPHFHEYAEDITFRDLFPSSYSSERTFPEEEIYLTSNGKVVHVGDVLHPGRVYHVIPRLLGGKGGFGSMLRAIGAQIEKTTNHEACRDLSGRRLRDVNNEKQLKDWLGKKAEKEKEEEEKRQERLAKRRALPNHKFDDPQYDQQKNRVAENLEDALQKGLQKTHTSSSASHSLGAAPSSSSSSGCRKRTTDSHSHKSAKVKKTTEWLGIDMEDLSDSDNNDDVTCIVPETVSPGSGSDNSDTQCKDKGVTKCDDNKNLCESDHASTGNGTSKNPEETNIDMTETTKDNNSTGSKNTEETNIDMTETTKDNDSTSSKNTEETNIDMTETTNNNDSSGSKNGLLTALQAIPPKQAETVQQEKEPEQDEPLDLDSISSVEELEAFSLEKLKKELMARGMKCGGTLKQRAERLYSVRGLTTDQIKPSLLAKRT